MFRRSNSSTHIPLRKQNLFGTNTRATQGSASIRSQSASRLSHRDSETATLRQPRKSSLDRKSNTLGITRATPVARPSRAGSLQRTTPSSAISSRRTSSRSATPTSCHQERKVTIQKLASDKKWVAEQYLKVQHFIAENPDIFDPNVVNTTNIKPPTINIFIYVTEMLFMEIFPKIKLRSENYKEVIPAQLKLIRYPGTMAASVLKTVNTMHSWPQVIGMWSWLIDKVKLGRPSEDPSFTDHLEPEERQRHLLVQNCWDFFTRRYAIFNNNSEDSTEEVQQANNEYTKNLADILQVDFEKYQQLQQDVSYKKKYKDKQIADIEPLKADMLRMQSEIDDMKKEIDDFQEEASAKEDKLDAELEHLQVTVKELRDREVAARERIDRLKEDVKVQPCTYQEKLSLLRQIDELKSETQVKKEKIEHAQTIKNQFDHRLTNEISKIKAIVVQWNRSLMELCIQKPELKKLMLREKGFHDPEFLIEIKEILNHKISTEVEIKQKLRKLEIDLVRQKQEKEATERDVEELAEIAENTNRECVELEEKIGKMKKKIKEAVTDLEQKRKYHLECMKKLQEGANLEEQAKVIAELKQKKETLDVEVKKFAQKMLSFFVEMHNQVLNNVKEMTAMRNTVMQNVEDRFTTMAEKRQRLKEVLEFFKKANEESKKAIEESG